MTFQIGHPNYHTEESKRKISEKLKGGNSGSFKKGEHRSEKTEFKQGEKSQEKNVNWKGDKATYWAKHIWLKYNFGKADKCENPKCKKISKMFNWCLKAGFKMTHNKNNFIQLCISCHRLYDNGKLKIKLEKI